MKDFIKYDILFKLHIWFGHLIGFYETSPVIKKIWYDPGGEIYIHTNCRSGVFYLPIKGGKEQANFLCAYTLTKELPKGETIYKLMDISIPKTP